MIFIVSAPSGAGKTTLVRGVLEELQGLHFAISCTTRPPRANEQDGVDYHFVTPEDFQKRIDGDEFLEWAEVLGNRYGTPRVSVETLESEKADLILDIDTQGAKKVKEKWAGAILIYILPPSLSALEERLIRRGLDAPDRIRFRLANAKRDIEEAHGYHYVIVNDDMEEAKETLKAIIIAERCRRGKDRLLLEEEDEWEVNHGKNHRGRLSKERGKPV